LLERNPGLSARDAEERIAAQMPLEAKCALADIVVRNDGGREELANAAQRLLATGELRQPRWLHWLIYGATVVLPPALLAWRLSGWISWMKEASKS
jgi:dephospho-CoA kinase